MFNLKSSCLPVCARLEHWLLPPKSFILALLPTDPVCAEIGSFKGDFAALILAIGRPKELHLIDPWKHEASPVYDQAWYGGKTDQSQMDAIFESVQKRFQKQIGSGQVTVHRKTSEAARADFPDAYFDWIYVDGNHLYEFVAKDLRLFYPKVKPGGFVCGDDYGDGQWWKGGVSRAVDEFVRQGFCEKVIVKERQFILKKPETSCHFVERPLSEVG